MEKKSAPGRTAGHAARAAARHTSKLVAILLAASMTGGYLLRESHLGRTLRVNRTLHFWTHVTLFAVLALLAATSTAAPRTRWMLFAAVLLFGYGTEFYEHLKDGFPVESRDVLADGLGACLGAATFFLARLLSRRKLHARLRLT